MSCWTDYKNNSKRTLSCFICFSLQKTFCWPTLAYAVQKPFYEPVHTMRGSKPSFCLSLKTPREGAHSQHTLVTSNNQPAQPGSWTGSDRHQQHGPGPAPRISDCFYMAQSESSLDGHDSSSGSDTGPLTLTRRRGRLSGQPAAVLSCRWSTVIDARWLPRQLLGSSASYFCLATKN